MIRNPFNIAICAVVFSTAALAFEYVPTQLVRHDLTELDRKRVAAVTRPASQFLKPEKFEMRQGGAGTSLRKVSRNAFSNHSQNLKFEQQQDFVLGNALFRKLWVSSPSSTHASDGLGPLFNARSCQTCHLRDGRGHPPEDSTDSISMLMRLARPASTPEEEKALREYVPLNFPDPVYGGQLQDLAVPGLAAEGKFSIHYEELPIRLRGGETVNLRSPSYAITGFSNGPLHPATTFSPRIAPPMIGLGLIEAIHPSDILRLADEDDKDADGISGKPALVRDPASDEVVIGRFGWKASQPDLRSQTADAFNGDIGLSSPGNKRHFGDCTHLQTDCLNLASGVQLRLGDTELPDPILDLVTFYSRNLAVPARRSVADKTVLQGKGLFYETGCVACHTPKFVTRRDTNNEEHAFQLIWPYSDFLLHDMGEGLADGQEVGRASGREWRTPPLWGIGLTKIVNGHTFFLHDGRARNLTEAILWHGGEAQSARDKFADMEKYDRDALIKFLESL